MARKKESFNNLIDVCIALEEDPEVKGSSGAMFNRILADCFFRDEVRDSRSLENFIETLDPPPFPDTMSSLCDIDIEMLRQFVEGEMINNSLCGRIILSPPYLKSFYKNHPPAFGQMPPDVQSEIVDQIKERNSLIIEAFEKILSDRDADKNRKVLTLVALIIKNIHKKNGMPLNNLGEPADKIIRSVYPCADEVFTGVQKQMGMLGDDSSLKNTIKKFFSIRQFKDITEVADCFRKELERYRKRAVHAFRQ
jgi:hypothetical protein